MSGIRGLFGIPSSIKTTSTAAEQLPGLTLDRLNEAMKIVEELRASEVWIAVSEHLTNLAPMIEAPTFELPGLPKTGRHFLAPYLKALEIHQHTPLVPLPITVNGWCVFRPANQFDRFAPKILPAPPYLVDSPQTEEATGE